MTPNLSKKSPYINFRTNPSRGIRELLFGRTGGGRAADGTKKKLIVVFRKVTHKLTCYA